MTGDFEVIHNKIAELLKAMCPPFKVNKGANGFAVVVPGDLVINERRFTNLDFASVVIQKSFVGFYFMPIYMNQSLLDKIPVELRKCLKGKTCFHIKNDEPLLFKQIKKTLDLGKDCYKKLNWI